MNIDVVDGGGEDEDAVQLAHSVSWEVDPYTVEESMLQPLLRSVYADMKDGSWRDGGREREKEKCKGGREE